MFNDLLQEKQLQPSKGEKEGRVLFIGGSPGSGKTWALNNVTDIKSRYKVFDIDDIKELLSKYRSERLETSAIDFVRSMETVNDELKSKIINDISSEGFWTQLSKRDHSVDVIHEFLTATNLFTNKITKFLTSISPNNKPNIAFNSTMQNLVFVGYLIDILAEIGYDVTAIEVLWVLSPQAQSDENIEIRNRERKTDSHYVTLVRNKVSRNMLDILQGKSKISNNINRMYIIVNDKDNIQYYDNTNIVKDFSYYNIKLSDKKKVLNTMRKILRDRYV